MLGLTTERVEDNISPYSMLLLPVINIINIVPNSIRGRRIVIYRRLDTRSSHSLVIQPQLSDLRLRMNRSLACTPWCPISTCTPWCPISTCTPWCPISTCTPWCPISTCTPWCPISTCTPWCPISTCTPWCPISTCTPWCPIST